MRGITLNNLNTANTGAATQIGSGLGFTLTPGAAGTAGASIPMNVNNVSVGVGVAAYVTGTVSYTLYHTYDDIENAANVTPTWFQHGVSNMNNATSTQESNFVIPISAVQFILNSGSGSVNVRVLQQGII